MHLRRRTTALVAALALIAGSAWTAGAAETGFTDVAGPHAPNIEAIAAAGVTAGCNADGTEYCPGELVTRAQMATFLARALGLDPITDGPTRFSDVSGTHAPNIEAVAVAGITLGCDAAGTSFCPNDRVSRAQMASFLARGFGFAAASGNAFADVSGSHADNIAAIAAAGVTLGCNADGTLYCPADPVRRDHMASFLARAMGIDPVPYRIAPSAAAVEFGQTAVGSAAVIREVRVTNTGQNETTITETTISGSAAGDFAITSGAGPGSLAPGAARTLWLAYSPTSASGGVESATLSVASADADTVTVALSGSAVVIGNVAPMVTNPGDLNGDPGDPISLQISATDADGDSISFSATGLPDGLAISSSGLISGTLAGPGTSSVVVSADDGVAAGFAQFSWHVNGSDPGAGFDLSLDRFYLTQAVPALDSAQAAADQVPVVAGRDGLARAFVAASGANSAAPIVRVHWQGTAGSGSLTLAGPGSVPTSPAEGTLGDTFSALVAGNVIGADTQIYVEVDPDNVIAETDETNNRYPASGWLDLAAVVVPTLEITLVPITFQGVTPDLSDPAAFLEDTLDMLPIAEYDIEVRPTPWVISESTLDWGAVLGDIANLRASDGSARMYHGIIDPGYSSGIAGIGYIGWPVAVSWNRSGAAGVVAHELGHNFNLTHAPCGTGGNPSYPHADGKIGVWGYELDSATLYDPAVRYDFMSYCNPVWISDYSYDRTLDWRVASGYSVVEPAAGETTLVVGGTIDGGTATLRPLYSRDVPAVAPTPGPHRLIGRDATGAVVFSRSFAAAAAEVSDNAAAVADAFSFGISLSRADLERVVSVEIRSGNATLLTRSASAAPASPPAARLLSVGAGWTWDTDAYQSAVLVDPTTGLVSGIDRSGVVDVDGPVDVVLSDGIRTETIQLRP